MRPFSAAGRSYVLNSAHWGCIPWLVFCSLVRVSGVSLRTVSVRWRSCLLCPGGINYSYFPVVVGEEVSCEFVGTRGSCLLLWKRFMI